MDLGTFTGLYTGFLILIFIGIFAWAYSSRRKKSFDEAANLVFDDELKDASAAKGVSGSNAGAK